MAADVCEHGVVHDLDRAAEKIRVEARAETQLVRDGAAQELRVADGDEPVGRRGERLAQLRGERVERLNDVGCNGRERLELLAELGEHVTRARLELARIGAQQRLEVARSREAEQLVEAREPGHAQRRVQLNEKAHADELAARGVEPAAARRARPVDGARGTREREQRL